MRACGVARSGATQGDAGVGARPIPRRRGGGGGDRRGAGEAVPGGASAVAGLDGVRVAGGGGSRRRWMRAWTRASASAGVAGGGGATGRSVRVRWQGGKAREAGEWAKLTGGPRGLGGGRGGAWRRPARRESGRRPPASGRGSGEAGEVGDDPAAAGAPRVGRRCGGGVRTAARGAGGRR